MILAIMTFFLPKWPWSKSNHKRIAGQSIYFSKKEKVSGNIIPIDDIFLGKEMISAGKIDSLRSAVKRHFGRKFGNLALKKGFATQEQVNNALKEQAIEFKASQSYRRTGDILVANNAITKEQCDIIRREMTKEKSFDGEKEPIKKSTPPAGNRIIKTLDNQVPQLKK